MLKEEIIDLRPEWRIERSPVDYPDAVAAMEARVAAIRAGDARELIWLLEHPPLYSAGTSAKPDDLLQPDRFPVLDRAAAANTPTMGPASGSLT